MMEGRKTKAQSCFDYYVNNVIHVKHAQKIIGKGSVDSFKYFVNASLSKLHYFKLKKNRNEQKTIRQ